MFRTLFIESGYDYDYHYDWLNIQRYEEKAKVVTSKGDDGHQRGQRHKTMAGLDKSINAFDNFLSRRDKLRNAPSDELKISAGEGKNKLGSWASNRNGADMPKISILAAKDSPERQGTIRGENGVKENGDKDKENGVHQYTNNVRKDAEISNDKKFNSVNDDKVEMTTTGKIQIIKSHQTNMVEVRDKEINTSYNNNALAVGESKLNLEPPSEIHNHSRVSEYEIVISQYLSDDSNSSKANNKSNVRGDVVEPPAASPGKLVIKKVEKYVIDPTSGRKNKLETSYFNYNLNSAVTSCLDLDGDNLKKYPSASSNDIGNILQNYDLMDENIEETYISEFQNGATLSGLIKSLEANKVRVNTIKF
eukprot:TRINITY_DN11777_c0_g3_i3.p1 TRINITY_DN11777_c0_g3~~TRINITY_DN11777_c0_g3_i3.p1  ORF type:complete len:363 (+),score=53.20 TRINITY_DN11777_c0_g3_i3:806-1894(+)